MALFLEQSGHDSIKEHCRKNVYTVLALRGWSMTQIKRQSRCHAPPPALCITQCIRYAWTVLAENGGVVQIPHSKTSAPGFTLQRPSVTCAWRLITRSGRFLPHRSSTRLPELPIGRLRAHTAVLDVELDAVSTWKPYNQTFRCGFCVDFPKQRRFCIKTM